MKRKIGYCGNICDYCPLYIATESGDKDKLARVAILWHKVGVRPQILPPEEMACHGCTPDKTCPFGIIKCALEKNVNDCGGCPEYPCPNLKSRLDFIPQLSEDWKKVCTKEEYDLVHRAFWQKKENLDKAHEKYLANKRDEKARRNIQVDGE